MTYNKFIYSFLVFLLLIGACKKTAYVPGEGREAYVNFFNASEVLQQNVSVQEHNWLILNHTLNHAKAEFSFGVDDRAFPNTSGISPLTPDGLLIPANSNYYQVYWMPLYEGINHISFTADSAYTVLKDTTVNLTNQKFSTHYLVENAITDTSYSIFTFPVENQRIEGHVSLQLVNLSPDFGPVDVYRSDSDGNQIGQNLATSLRYGSSTSFLDVDTIGSHSTRENIILKFKKSGDKNIVATQVVPGVPASGYVAIFRGFEKSTPRRIRMRGDTYRSFMVGPNLRVNLRRLY